MLMETVVHVYKKTEIELITVTHSNHVRMFIQETLILMSNQKVLIY